MLSADKGRQNKTPTCQTIPDWFPIYIVPANKWDQGKTLQSEIGKLCK
jgi:hypothetical protein